MASLNAALERKSAENKDKKTDKRYKHIKFFGAAPLPGWRSLCALSVCLVWSESDLTIGVCPWHARGWIGLFQSVKRWCAS